MWWTDAVGYEVYLRSFADSNGDGVGDLAGLHARLDHIAGLGCDVVWITPFYPSPGRDHGYDVADYCAVDPRLGDLATLEVVVARAHDLGLRVLIDLVPNHTSSVHPWFLAARSDRSNPHRDYYIWRDPAPDGGPPNNWRSVFGGPAWTLDDSSGQYWLHLFLPEQPDLNWANPKVVEEFDRILGFWLDRGIDGFRIDVAHGLAKHPDLPDNPPATVRADLELATVAGDWAALEHLHDVDQPANVEVYRRWRRIADPADALLLGEVYLLRADRLRRYLSGDGLHAAFWFAPLHIAWDARRITAVLREATTLPVGAVVWVQGSHDRRRAASRYGGGDAGRARQLAMAVLQMGLPGMTFIYQGEELGLTDARLDWRSVQDPLARRERDTSGGRDVARTPIPWDADLPAMGFTRGTPWLPLGERTTADAVATQTDDPNSMLERYRRLLSVQRAHLRLGDTPVEWLDAAAGMVAYRRGDVAVAANLGSTAERFRPPAASSATLYSAGHVADDGDTLQLAPASAVIVRAETGTV